MANQLNQNRVAVIRYFLTSQILQKHPVRAFCLNIKRVTFYVTHLKDMRKLNKLISAFPLTNTHKFKIKFGALFNYLSRSFSFEEALPNLIANYTYISENFSKSSLDEIFSEGLECWRHEIYNIKLIKTKAFDFEGSFALIFNIGKTTIYTLSFSFIRSIAEPESWVLYIARKQGQVGMLAEFRKTAKTFDDNKIVTMVLAAAEGLSLSLGINTMIGVGTANQLSNLKEELRETFIHSYNDYWETQESVRMEDGDYILPVPMLFKPLEQIPAHHKKRTVLKRQRRHEISVAVRASIDGCRPSDFLVIQPQSDAENFFKSEIFLMAKASA